MPAYKKLPEVIIAVSKILTTGEQSNVLAKRAFVKAEIIKALLDKELTPAEFEAQLTTLVEDRFSPYGQPRSIGAPVVTEIRYGDAASLDVDASVSAYVEAAAALELTAPIKEQLKKQIMQARVATKDRDLIYDGDVSEEELLGILLLKVRDKKMSWNIAIKTLYLRKNKADLELDYFQKLIATMTAEQHQKLLKAVPSINLDNLIQIQSFFRDEIQNQYVDKVKDEIRNEIKSQEAISIPPIIDDFRYLYYQDECFPLYCANWVKGKNYIAMSGAKSSESVAVLMHSLLFSDTMKDKPQVTTIIALGNCTQPVERYSSSNRMDFYNYCYDESELSKLNVISVRKSFSVATKKQEDKSQDFQYQISVTNQTASFHYTGKSGFVLSELKVLDKKLEVLLIGLQDGYSLDLGIESQETEQLKELLWKISQKPSTEAVAVHCAAGVGRTGHIILTLEIIKNHQRIFASDNPVAIANEIEAIVNNMRLTRPALVYSLEQYFTAIENADILYQYALDKKYVTQPAPVSIMSFLTPLLKPSAQDQEKEPANSRGICRVS
jgi:hypothetical protein